MTERDAGDAHYTLSLINHQTGQQLRVELVYTPFPARSYRVRINGEGARRVPVASKTAVLRQPRQCFCGLPAVTACSITVFVMRSSVASRSPEGKRIRPNNSALKCRIIRPN